MINRAANNNTLTKLAQFNPSGECLFEKKFREKSKQKETRIYYFSEKNVNKQVKAILSYFL